MDLWGGDANPNNGDYTGVPGLADVVASGNVVSGGTVWASEAQRISFTGNTVVGAGDIGLDCEGCTDYTATGNVVRTRRPPTIA